MENTPIPTVGCEIAPSDDIASEQPKGKIRNLRTRTVMGRPEQLGAKGNQSEVERANSSIEQE